MFMGGAEQRVLSKASLLWLLVKLLMWLICLSKHAGCAQAIYCNIKQYVSVPACQAS